MITSYLLRKYVLPRVFDLIAEFYFSISNRFSQTLDLEKVRDDVANLIDESQHISARE